MAQIRSPVHPPDPPPPPPSRAPAFDPPRINSVNNLLVTRLRMAQTIFADRIILSLRQIEDEHYTRLDRPYLIVVPRQVRGPRQINGDDLAFINPREVWLVAQFDDRMSKDSHLAANDIDTAEQELIAALVGWRPQRHFALTQYAGMRIQSTRVPDVKVAYMFMLYEQFSCDEEPPEWDPNNIPFAMEVENIHVRIASPCSEDECEPAPDPCS